MVCGTRLSATNGREHAISYRAQVETLGYCNPPSGMDLPNPGGIRDPVFAPHPGGIWALQSRTRMVLFTTS
jgi:hypothetical protein